MSWEAFLLGVSMLPQVVPAGRVDKTPDHLQDRAQICCSSFSKMTSKVIVPNDRGHPFSLTELNPGEDNGKCI